MTNRMVVALAGVWMAAAPAAAQDLSKPDTAAQHSARLFTRRDRARMLLVLRGKRLGFTLAEIRGYLDLYDADPTQRRQVELLLEKVRARAASLEVQRRDIDEALADLRDIEQQAEAALDDDTPRTGT